MDPIRRWNFAKQTHDNYGKYSFVVVVKQNNFASKRHILHLRKYLFEICDILLQDPS